MLLVVLANDTSPPIVVPPLLQRAGRDAAAIAFRDPAAAHASSASARLWTETSPATPMVPALSVAEGAEIGPMSDNDPVSVKISSPPAATEKNDPSPGDGIFRPHSGRRRRHCSRCPSVSARWIQPVGIFINTAAALQCHQRTGGYRRIDIDPDRTAAVIL